eukprot:snap_masked-scaffold177_size283923-processed-gene-0.10 protein:Tk02063 transcript:snap_masked-scaffold177_size283923-processed-gene-0.10-mRNA-1 annotation:"AGAP002114-PA"
MRRHAKDLKVVNSTIQEAVNDDLNLRFFVRAPRHLVTDIMMAKRLERCQKLLSYLRHHGSTIKIFPDKIFTVDQVYNRHNDCWLKESTEEVKGVLWTKHPAQNAIKPSEMGEDLFFGLRGAGSSFGVITEFLYKIYAVPEIQPVLLPIFIRSPEDIKKLEALNSNGIFHINTLEGHTARVGALAWNGDMLSSSSGDRLILQRDIRTPSVAPERRLAGHQQEVCGLKWSPDNQYLASGGNDSKLFVWNLSSDQPVHAYTEHKAAAVKAIAWSPHHHGLLASGGGTADRRIRFWNTLTGQPMQSVDTGSQVCNLAWSKHASELVSTHGFSENQILVWKYPSLVQVAKLTGHSYRVLYLAMSPDGEAIVTEAGDETLRFWNVFSKARSQTCMIEVVGIQSELMGEASPQCPCQPHVLRLE